MTLDSLHFVVPGPIDQRTGGYLYDARMVAEMRAAGRDVVVHELDGVFPDVDDAARRSMARALTGIPDDGVVVVDGLAGGCLPDILGEHAGRLRLVALVHHPLAEETGLTPKQEVRYAERERAALAACRGVVVTSPFTRSRMAVYGIAARRVWVAVPGTEPAESATGPEPAAPPRLLCVASITPRKGHMVLLDALHEIRQMAWHCVLAGSETLAPDHARAVRDRVRVLQLDDRVSFLGELDAATLDEEYRASTLFVLPSHYEGYGMVLTEAMARGLPVLSTTGGAIPYTVPAEAGVLVRPGDAEALVGALRTLLKDEGGILGRLREGAARVAAELPDWSEAGRGFMEAVDAASRGPGPAEPEQSAP